VLWRWWVVSLPRLASAARREVPSRVTSEIERLVAIHHGLPKDPETRRILRESSGLSRSQMAKIVGVTRQAIYYWETGARTPSPGQHFDNYVEALQALRGSR
jgi:DNA-binding transcriptional regulator YiaG